MSACPRCGGAVAASQEYCLGCGLRLPGTARLAAPPLTARQFALPLIVAAVITVGGGLTAILLTRGTAAATPILTATGGSEPVPAAKVAASSLAEWPAATSAWTNILISIPKVEGRDAAIARAEQARRQGLTPVGVLDSSRYASLHPGYWMVFAGVYPSEPEATSRLREAKAVQRGARTERVSP